MFTNTKAKIIRSKYIGVISLGCDKNRVDTEFILTKLADAGFQFSSDYTKVDVIIVNTCAFIEPSRVEARSTISEMLELKKLNKNLKIVVCGCYPQAYLDEIVNTFPEVDAFIGTNEYNDIVQIINNVLKGTKITKVDAKETIYYVENRKVTTPYNYAYLKIADGCDNFCTYCRIPYIRGRYRSQTIENLVKEAESLASYGTSEIVLVAQDVTKYGIDLYKKPQLVQLIRQLSKIDGIKWIRLLYCYPENLSDELISEIVNNDKVCKYVDIPLQHISTNVLKKMNRKSSYESICKLIEKLQSQKVFIALRSTFMLGFPGETQEDFDLLCKFLVKYKLSNVGFFKYSSEKGTASYNIPETVSEKEKQKRLNIVSKLQQEISEQVNSEFIGKTLSVVVEGVNDDATMFVGRDVYQAPDVDGVVYFTADEELGLGDIVQVEIHSVYKKYDLQGEKL